MFSQIWCTMWHNIILIQRFWSTHPDLSYKLQQTGQNNNKNTWIGKIYDSYQYVLKSSMLRTTNTIFRWLGVNYHQSDTILFSSGLNDSGVHFIEGFSRTFITYINKTGNILRYFIVNSVNFYNIVKMIKAINQTQ